MKRLIVTLALCLSALPSGADPLREAMKTPVSVLDLFLFRLHEASKCASWMPNLNAPEPTLCLTGLRFSARDAVLRLYFREAADSADLGDFQVMNELEREAFLYRYIDRLAQRAGVVNEWGMIHSLPLTATPVEGFDDDAFRRALAERTEVHLNIEHDGSIYAVSRLANGELTFEIR